MKVAYRGYHPILKDTDYVLPEAYNPSGFTLCMHNSLIYKTSKMMVPFHN